MFWKKKKRVLTDEDYDASHALAEKARVGVVFTGAEAVAVVAAIEQAMEMFDRGDPETLRMTAVRRTRLSLFGALETVYEALEKETGKKRPAGGLKSLEH